MGQNTPGMTGTEPSGRKPANIKYKPKTPKPPSTVGRNIGRGFALVLLAAIGLVGGLMLGSKSARKYLGAVIQHPFVPLTPADVFPAQNSINLMIIGRDYDYSDRDQIVKTSARSDLLMVAHLDFKNNSAALLSIPRDTRAEIPGWGIGKINAAHAHGGPTLSEQTVQSMYGIVSDKYVALDFVGFEKAIDELGGVSLTVDKKMDYDDNWGHLHIHLKPGFQHLDGAKAMGFVRFRHSDSDFVRAQRQQVLLAALKEKLRDPTVLVHLPNILDTLDAHMASDLNTDQKVVLGRFLHSLPHEQIRMATMPSLESSGTFVYTDWPKASPLIQNMFGVTPPEREASVPRHRRRRHTSG